MVSILPICFGHVTKHSNGSACLLQSLFYIYFTEDKVRQSVDIKLVLKVIVFFFWWSLCLLVAGGLPQPSFHLSWGGGSEEHGEQLPRAAASLRSHRPLFLHSFPSGGAVSWSRQEFPLTVLEPKHTVTTQRDDLYTHDEKYQTCLYSVINCPGFLSIPPQQNVSHHSLKQKAQFEVGRSCIRWLQLYFYIGDVGALLFLAFLGVFWFLGWLPTMHKGR